MAGRWPELLSQALGLGGQGWSRWGQDAAGVAAGHLDDLADSFAPATAARTTEEARAGRSAGHRAQERGA